MYRTTINNFNKNLLRISVVMFLLFGLTAQANAQLEYMVRENTTDTNAVPSSEFSFGWNAQTHASGTAVTYDLGEFHINIGKYLVLYTQEWETTDTTTNTRKEIQGRLAVDGTTIDAGASQCYIRKTGGDQSCVTAGNAVLDITSDYTTLETLFYRTDDNATGIPTRENAGQNGVQIIKLGDDWNYGRYSLSTTQSATVSTTVFDDVVWDTTDEQDTGFSRSGAGITIADAGRYLVTYSLPLTKTEDATRTDITSRLILDGTEVEGTRVSSYMRGSESTNSGVLNYVGIIDVAAGDILKVQEVVPSGSQVTYQGGSIEIVQLPASAKTFIREATTGDQNPASLTEFSWDTTAYIDTDTFTINSATDSFTEVDSAGDYLFFWSAWTESSSATRGKPSAALSVNDALVDYGLSARYHRANSSDNRAGHSNGAFVPSMSAGDDVSLEVVGLSAAGTMNVSHGAHSGLRLDTLYAEEAGPSTLTISGIAEIPFLFPITGATVAAAVGTSTPSLHTAVTDGSGIFTIDLGAPYTGGETWTVRSAVGNNDDWGDIVYGNGIFVAVGDSGDRVMTSPDGITWTARSAAGNNDGWQGVTYGNGIFVAVGDSGDRVMTSPDGITWTARSAAGNNDSWSDVTYSEGLFVAVGYGGGDRVMTSPDGITWTARSAAGNDDEWRGVTYGNGIFVAVGSFGDMVMTSPDGITWTARSTSSGTDDQWRDVTYGNGLFVAVANFADNIITSPDGINWTVRYSTGGATQLRAVTYANNTFVAVGSAGNRIMISTDGITWNTTPVSGNLDAWYGVTYGNGIFVTVGDNTYGYNRTAMTAPAGFGEDTPITLFLDDQVSGYKSTALTYGRNEPATITGVNLWADNFFTGYFDSVGVVDLSNADFYDADDDDDILFNSDTGTTTISASALWLQDTELYAPQKLDLQASSIYLLVGSEFYAERGEVLLTGLSNQTFYTSGTTTFHDLTALTNSARTLVFPSGNEFVVEGELMLSGAEGEPLSVEGSSSGSEFYIRPNGAVTTEYLNVKDSHNISTVNPSLDCTTGCVDGGNNEGWGFPIIPSITGTLYQSDGTTPLTDKTVVAAVGTSTPSLHSATTDESGNFIIAGIASSTGAESWTARSAVGNNDEWYGVTYGNGLFVAVGPLGDRVMTSPDGITWTARTAAGDNDTWRDVVYGNGVFVAVGDSGDRVMTSPDGITWTVRSAAGNNDFWHDITYGNGLFAAVSYSGDHVITSPDGINWTARTISGDSMYLTGITYGNGVFVAVSQNEPVAVSTDGITWTLHSASGNNDMWAGVTYGNGLFVAVRKQSYGGNEVMTSPDGETWTNQTVPGNHDWNSVTYANGMFVAVGNAEDGEVATSPDGINWTVLSAPIVTESSWLDVTYGNGVFVAVGNSVNQVMTADAGFGENTPITLYVDGETEDATTLTYGLNDAETVTGIDLVQDAVRFQYSSTTGEVDMYDFYNYDSSDDADVLHTWLTEEGGVTSLVNGDLIVASNTTLVAPQQLAVTGGMTMGGQYEASRGTFYMTNGFATTTHQLNTSATTTFHNFYSLAYFDGSAVEFTSGEEYVFEGELLLAGTDSEPLSVEASSPGSEFYIRPDGAVTIEYLNVKDSHNISTVNTSLDCTTGCVDGGNNEGWNIPITDLSVSGVVYQADGTTPLTGKTITAAVGTSTPSLHSVTTNGSGEYTIDLGAPYASVTSWATSSMMGDNDDWTGHAYGNGMHVLVARFDGGDGKVGYSTDGINWTQTSAAGDNGDWYDVTYGNGLFVAVGDSTGTRDSVMTSPDGINWTARSAVGDNDNWSDVAYGDGVYVAIARCNYGGDDCAMISEDGINWTSVTMPSGNDDEWAKVAYGDGRFVAIQNSGPAAVSTDGGETWTEYAMVGNNENWSDITYGNGKFVAASNQFGGNDRIAYSTDGTSWTSADQVSADSWIRVTYGNGLYVAIGNANNHTIAYSTDAVSWTKLEVADGDDDWGGIGFGGGLFIAYGNAATGSDDNFMYANAGFGEDTPITLFIDGETEKASALTYGRNELGVITGINMVEDSVFLRHSSTTGAINFSRTDLYDATDDVDVLFTTTAATTTVTGDLIVDTNTTLLGPQKLELQNDLTINGTFAAQGGEVLLTGGDQTITTSATTTFHDFTAATTSARALTFTSGEEYVFEGALTLTGASGQLTSLNASTPDSEYFFRPNAVATTQYLDIQDAHNISTTTAVIECGGGCVDSGNISGWNFPLTNITLSGTLFESDGSTPILSGKTITAAVGVSTPSLHSATTDGSGNYTIDIGAPAAGGAVWSTATPANAWDELKSIAYGDGQFVAVSTCYYAGGNCVVTSPDGVTWTGRSAAPADGDWHSVTYGADDGLYVAVGHIGDYVMTSPDGITWTPRSAAGNNDQWNSITYGNGRFVAVANTGDFAMYSDDGITWTVPTTVSGGWDDVTYGNGQFVAVATFGFGDSEHVMTSPDGINWTAYHAAEDNDWRGVRYGNGVYVAVANQGTNRVMTSPDGQTWTARSIAGNDDDWQSLEFADGVFVAVADCDGGGDCVATSPDGITWTVQTAPANSWRGVAAGEGKFVAVGAYDGPDRVMYSESGLSAGTPITLYVNDETEKATTLTYGLATPAEVSGMDLYQDTVRLQYASTSGTVDVSNIDFYDASDDADILLDVTAATTTVAADLIVHTNTELQAPQKLELKNDLTINGTFAAQGGEVLLTGGDQTITTSATTTFHDFTAATTSARALTFTSGEEYVFEGALTLTGASGQLTSLNASTPDSEYFFRPNATVTASYLDVTDSHNISATNENIDCTGRCVSGGNNSGWAVVTVAALAATDVSVSTATLNGDVVANGGVAVTNRGFIYSTESDFSSNVATSSESSSYNISSAVFEGIALDVSPQESAPYAMLFNDDGTVLYVMGVAQDDIRSYNLSVAYDISTAVYDEIVLDVSPQETVPTDMLFNDDGTVLYVLGYSSDNVNAYTLSVAYDISTAVFESIALDVVSEGVPKGMTFNGDGTVLYVMGSAQDDIRSYSLSVAYDISTAVYDEIVLDVSPQETNPYSMLFNDDGTTLYVIGFITDSIHAYSLSVAYDISTAVYESVALNVSLEEGAPAEIMFNNDGTRLYVTGESGDDINAYTLTFAEGTYSRDITSLEGGTTYYARAFAENSFGVAYSTTTINFTTDTPAILDIADNDAGQVSDTFGFQNKTDTELFAFKFSTTTVGLTVTNLDVSLSGVKNITGSNLQNIELYVDVDNDAEYDSGLDTFVSAGAVSINGDRGAITFTSDFAVTGAVNYLVVGDTNAIQNGSYITFNLSARDIEVEGGIASGTVSSIQHSRHNSGGGGGSAAAIADEVIPGDGDVGGGGSGGGGEIDTNTGGALIGNSPDFKAPASHVGSWTNPENAYDNTDGTYATTIDGSFADYSAYDLGVPGSNTIQGIEVKLELSGTTAAGTIDVQLSWDNRRTWTTVKTTPVMTTTDAVVSLGGSSDLWGRAWTVTDFNTGNFAVRLVGNPSSNTIQVDEIRVRVYHQATGGGGGGGGGAI